jgi:hypothetical protein
MVIRFFSQLMSALCSATLQYFLTAFAFHSGTESMGSDTVFSLWLISSLWHSQ